MKTSWSGWSRFGVKELSNVPEKEGVYQLRCVDGTGAAITISRLNNNDPGGIIYIGSSDNLKKRLKGFWRTIEMKDRSRHAAAWTCCSFGYDSIFPPKQINNIGSLGDEFSGIENAILFRSSLGPEI